MRKMSKGVLFALHFSHIIHQWRDLIHHNSKFCHSLIDIYVDYNSA